LITLGDPTEAEIQAQIDTFDNRTAVYQVTTETPYHIEGSGKRVAIMDYGVKNSIVEHFRKRGCDITVYPAGTTADAVLASEPELVFLSNGPGDPKDVPSIVGEVKKMIDAKPVVGICLGHQLIALAMGGSTGKLKFGHHGCNHPVKDLRQDRVFITSQNHGYYVEKLPEHAEITHKSMNDDTVEGMRLTDRPVFSVQFHPEAAPGPVESDYLFDQFLTYAK
jgi:carbamoyl-phosphate synthase small subunit